MINAITFVRFFRKKEADQLENRLKAYADVTGYNVVWHERLHYITTKSSADEIIIKTLNNQHYQGVKVDAILVVRYHHIHRKFTQTAKLIKTISHYGVRIISIEETVDENDPLFTEIYFPNQL
ncbi:MAG: recombinase family protein [Chitinophagaceae bacterium]|nr:recombinase family protein [Chitinophagaceae bacterium]